MYKDIFALYIYIQYIYMYIDITKKNKIIISSLLSSKRCWSSIGTLKVPGLLVMHSWDPAESQLGETPKWFGDMCFGPATVGQYRCYNCCILLPCQHYSTTVTPTVMDPLVVFHISVANIPSWWCSFAYKSISPNIPKSSVSNKFVVDQNCSCSHLGFYVPHRSHKKNLQAPLAANPTDSWGTWTIPSSLIQ